MKKGVEKHSYQGPSTFGRFWSQINICSPSQSRVWQRPKWGRRMCTKKVHSHSYLKSCKLKRDTYQTDETQTFWEIRKVFRANSSPSFILRLSMTSYVKHQESNYSVISLGCRAADPQCHLQIGGTEYLKLNHSAFKHCSIDTNELRVTINQRSNRRNKIQ